MRAFDPERVHERGRVLREGRDPVLAGRSLRPPDPAVVEGRDAPAIGQAGDLIDPARALVGQARDEDDVVALPGLLGVQLHAARIDRFHRAILAAGGAPGTSPSTCNCTWRHVQMHELS